jgi:hypothetical protein
VDDQDTTPGTRPCPQNVIPRRSRQAPTPQAHQWIEAKFAGEFWVGDFDRSWCCGALSD